MDILFAICPYDIIYKTINIISTVEYFSFLTGEGDDAPKFLSTRHALWTNSPLLLRVVKTKLEIPDCSSSCQIGHIPISLKKVMIMWRILDTMMTVVITIWKKWYWCYEWIVATMTAVIIVIERESFPFKTSCYNTKGLSLPHRTETCLPLGNT